MARTSLGRWPRLDLEDYDGDGKLERGTRTLHGPLGQIVRVDRLSNDGKWVPRIIRDWDGTSFVEYELQEQEDGQFKRVEQMRGVTDGRGNVLRTQSARSGTVHEYEYDDAGQMTHHTWRDNPGDSPKLVETWSYDQQGRVVSESREVPSQKQKWVRTLTYGPYGPASAEIRYDDNPPIAEVWEYDDKGRMTFRRLADKDERATLTRVVWDSETATEYSEWEEFEAENPPSLSTVDRDFTDERGSSSWYGCFTE